MASSINAAQPVFGTPTTASVRANFAAAKAEIEALQGRFGFVDYNDSATAGSPIAVSPSTWTKLTNNTLGTYTKTDALPPGVTTLWNTVNNQLSLSQLPLNTVVTLRADIVVTTSAANQTVKNDLRLAIGTGSVFTLENSASHFKTAGAQNMAVYWEFYIGSNDVKNNPGEIRLWSDASATVVVKGWYIKVNKAIA